jgi:hypothetical protein
MRLGWPHTWSGHFTEEKKLLKLLIQTPDHRADGPFTTMNTLSQHPVLQIYINTDIAVLLVYDTM